MAHSDYHQLFLHLDDLLASNSQWWQVGSFQRRDFPWRETQLELVDRLLSLDEVELLALEACPQHLARWLGPWIGEAENLLQLSQLPRLPQRTLDIPSRLEVGIKGRKWMQISNFAASIPAPCGTALEWCSGKGHLGRVLAVVDGSQVTSIEWQESLCDAGRQQAQSFQASQRFVQVDARSQAAVAEIGQHSCVLALHACGSLHMDLIRHWPASQSRSLMVAPCCYHLIAGDHYLPLSLQAQAAQVRLSKRCLNLPMQEVVTAGARERERRQKELLWRLAFDEWQRQARSQDEYLPLPNFPGNLLSGSFSDFVAWAANKKGLKVQNMSSPGEWLQRGQRRARQVRLVELVMHLFRRPLELWLALDRVLFLQGQGASVSLGEFCDYRVSPRNIMICAER